MYKYDLYVDFAGVLFASEIGRYLTRNQPLYLWSGTLIRSQTQLFDNPAHEHNGDRICTFAVMGRDAFTPLVWYAENVDNEEIFTVLEI